MIICKICGLDQQCCYHGRSDYLSEKKKILPAAKKQSMNQDGCDCSYCYKPFKATLNRKLEQKFYSAVLKTIEEGQIVALAGEKISKDLKSVVNKALKILKKVA